jgi:hypothetical protein
MCVIRRAGTDATTKYAVLIADVGTASMLRVCSVLRVMVLWSRR